jgi:hypothetical protein
LRHRAKRRGPHEADDQADRDPTGRDKRLQCPGTEWRHGVADAIEHHPVHDIEWAVAPFVDQRA